MNQEKLCLQEEITKLTNQYSDCNQSLQQLKAQHDKSESEVERLNQINEKQNVRFQTLLEKVNDKNEQLQIEKETIIGKTIEIDNIKNIKGT